MIDIFERIERVNQARKKAMENSTFIEDAKHHEQAISVMNSRAMQKKPKRKKKKSQPKKLSEIYSSYFGHNASPSIY